MEDKKNNKTTDIKKYNREYMKRYINNEKNKFKEYVICEECGIKYTKWNKGHHIKTLKHKYGKLKKEHNKNLAKK